MKKFVCSCGAKEFQISYDPAEDGLIFDISIKCSACGEKHKLVATWCEDYATIDIYGDEIENVHE